MNKSDRKYIALLGALLLLYVFVEFIRPKEVDWTPTFSRTHKTPYGGYLLYTFLPDLFPGQQVNTANRSIYEVVSGTEDPAFNYIFLNMSFDQALFGGGPSFEFDDLETEKLLEFVEAGNHVFMAAERFGGLLADTLNLSTETDAVPVFRQPGSQEVDTTLDIRMTLLNPALHSVRSYRFRQGSVNWYFSSFDTLRTTALGIRFNETNQPLINFIRINWGEGALFIHTAPRVFTNYNIVQGSNVDYLFKALSYLPVRTTVWDEYYKPGSSRHASTPLRYILQQPALRWAYFLALTGLILFILFRGRRRQRIIPVVTPPQNTTLAFVDTVGRLYYQQGNHLDLARKKIAYFRDYLRTHLNLDTNVDEQTLIKKVALRAGVASNEVQVLFRTIASVESRTTLSDEALMDLNDKIESFYAHAKR